MRRVSALRIAAVPALVGILLLAACSEEAPGPQFANEPAPTRQATSTVVIASPAPPIATPVAVATPSSIGDLLSVRGAPDVVYTASDSEVWMIASSGEATRLYQAPAGTRILSFDPGPSSMDVAVLTASREDAAENASLLILDREGAMQRRIEDFGGATATQVAQAGGSVDLVNWSPQGDRVLVAFRDGRIFDVPLGENAPPVPLDLGREAAVLQPTWSPTGQAIAFIAANADSRTRNLELYDVATGQTQTVVEAAQGRFVVDFVWMPDGVSLLFTEGGELAGAVTGIDLWRINADGTERSLLASAGTVAPVARITTMRPSPDGRSVAYAVLVPSDDEPVIDSIWVRDIASGIGYRIPLATITAIKDIVWTDQGLVASVVTGGPGTSRPEVHAMLIVRRSGEIGLLWAAPVAGGTPVRASPVASPANS